MAVETDFFSLSLAPSVCFVQLRAPKSSTWRQVGGANHKQRSAGGTLFEWHEWGRMLVWVRALRQLGRSSLERQKTGWRNFIHLDGCRRLEKSKKIKTNQH